MYTPKADAEIIMGLATDILNEDFYFGSLEDKVKLIRILAERIVEGR